MVISDFQVGVLKRVLEEVEKVMNEFKNMLYKSMEDPQIDLTNVSLFCTFWYFFTMCW
jgi:exocyst complex component 2